jgi:hypothetical protein
MRDTARETEGVMASLTLLVLVIYAVLADSVWENGGDQSIDLLFLVVLLLLWKQTPQRAIEEIGAESEKSIEGRFHAARLPSRSISRTIRFASLIRAVATRREVCIPNATLRVKLAETEMLRPTRLKMP